MTGHDLRYTRRQLGATPHQLAALAGIEAKDIEEWEALGTIPRKHRHALDLALWHLECDAALRKSGLPECGWMTNPETAATPEDLNVAIRHLESCPTCKARTEYLRSHVRPEPIGGSPMMRVFGMLERLSGWQQAAFGGAIMLLVMGGIGVPILLFLALINQDPAFAAGALALFVVLVVSGAAGGMVHYWTAPLREQGTGAYYASWVLTLYGYMLAALGLITLAPIVLGPGVGGNDLPTLSDPATWAIFGILGVVFGIALGRGTRSTDVQVPTAPEKRSPFSVRNGLIVLGVLVWIGINFLLRSNLPGSREDLEAALPGHHAAVRANPQDPKAQRELAWTLVGLERWQEAEPVLQEAVRLNPRDAYLHNSLGWAQMQRGEFNAAARLFERAIQLEPEHPYAHQNLGWTLYNLGRYEEAEPAYRKALQQNPQEASAQGGLGWVLHGMRRLTEAESEFRQAIRLEPTNAWHHQGLAVTVMQSGRLKEALPSYREATRLAPEAAGLWSDLGHAAHIAGEYVESAAAFDKAEQLEPESVRGHPLRRAMWEASRQGRAYVPEP
jgi:Flp pilus assembly protein TadD